MSNRNTPAIIRAILETKSLESSEILTVRRWFYGDGILHEEDAVAMFAANRVLCGSNLEFNKLFVEAITDFVVYQQMPTGRVSAEQADWLIARMGGPGGHVETVSEIDLLVNIMEEAHEIPTQLAAFAISQVKHAAITGEGPAARGRVHFSRTVDGRDVELLSRMLEKSGGTLGASVSREEADLLFDIADACSASPNDHAWDQLFARAIANHLLGASAQQRRALEHAPFVRGDGPEGEWQSSSRLDSASAAWLNSRIHRDGSVSSGERILLGFLDQAVPELPAKAAILRMS
jgi:hypothetical protein